ncbi:MAG: hypothetical protein HY547_01470 [Elusimicrobia bacterium]|nr:hypothetical protein [Elusimicrobiota bacterium]
MIWFLIYNALVPVLLLAAAIAAFFVPRVRQWWSAFGDLRKRRERLGSALPATGANCWIHCASLGEARLLVVFLELLKKQHSSVKVHATCMTETGVEFVRKNYVARGLVNGVSLLPIDSWWIMRRQVGLWPNGSLLVLTETELWPNLMMAAKKRGFKIALINGHFSQKTWRWLSMARSLARMLWGTFDVVCVSEESYKRDLADFRVENKPILVTGNMKWDTAMPAHAASSGVHVALKRRLGFEDGDFCWVGASTREGEEKVLLDIYQRLVTRNKGLRLILAPRHIERAGEVVAMAQRAGLNTSRWSRQREKTAQVTVIDEFGLLGPLYGVADGVFVGGTLVPKVGGHNFLEPAYLGKAIAIGPFIENFKDIAQEFVEQKAIEIVPDGKALEEVLGHWIKDPEDRHQIGENARRLFSSHQGGSQRTLDALSDLLKTLPS